MRKETIWNTTKVKKIQLMANACDKENHENLKWKWMEK